MRKKLILIAIASLAAILVIGISRPAIAILSLLGFDHPKDYLVLFQNNMEIRPTGGFMGSFARVRLNRGRLNLIKIEDIYTPDGQLDGHVDPPWPIQAAFGQGWFKLRDSNWDPDFPTSAKTVEWFFEHGGESKADGLIAVNLSLLYDVLKLTGPVYVIDSPEKISADNFYKLTQAAVEQNFFPGSTQKQDFLSKLGKAVFLKMQTMSLSQQLQLVLVGWQQLTDRQMLVYAHDQGTQSWLKLMNFDGSLADIRGTNQDYLAIFESNLGANKANCCIKRVVTLTRNGMTHDLKIHYENTNPASLKQPPQSWGGAYVNFLRIGVPIDAQVTSIKVGGIEYPVPSSQVMGESSSVTNLMKSGTDQDSLKFITGADSDHLKVDLERKDEKGTMFLGFFALVDALDSKDVEVSYTTSRTGKLFTERQSGDVNFKPL